MKEIKPILNGAMALPNIHNGNPLRHNDDAPCFSPGRGMQKMGYGLLVAVKKSAKQRK